MDWTALTARTGLSPRRCPGPKILPALMRRSIGGQAAPGTPLERLTTSLPHSTASSRDWVGSAQSSLLGVVILALCSTQLVLPCRCSPTRVGPGTLALDREWLSQER